MINTQTLKHAIVLQEKIEALQSELNSLLGAGFSSGPSSSPAAKGKRGGRRKMSAEAREKIAAAQRRRWSKFHAARGGKASPKAEKPEAASEKPAKKKKRKMSPEGLQRIKDAQAKRWAAVRKAKKAEK